MLTHRPVRSARPRLRSKAVQTAGVVALTTAALVGAQLSAGALARPAIADEPVVAVAAPAGARLSDGLAATLASAPAGHSLEAIVQFAPGTAAQRVIGEAAGVRVLADYEVLDALLVAGPPAAIRALIADPAVTYAEENETLELFGETAGWATQVERVRNDAGGGPYTTPGGKAYDGSGVGVVVLDSGVDASHPDLVDIVDRNYKWHVGLNRLAEFTDLGPGSSTDSSSGHGTHVSGILAGDGSASDGHYRGVAPGVALSVYSTGETISAAFVSYALDHLVANLSSFSPPVRIASLSLGNGEGTPFDPNSAVAKAVANLVAANVVVVWAAGNDGDDGSSNGASDQTSGYCKDPTPGVLCVANYDDGNVGDRDNELDSGSSRGKRGDPTTYPDLAAPGSSITSTCATTSGALCSAAGFITPSTAWAPYYGSAYGTSMATPHVSGIAALLLEANPALSPAAVEDILLDTAHRFVVPTNTNDGTYTADPQNPGSTTSYDKGAGLVDAVAALADPRVGESGDGATAPTVLVTGDGGDYAGPGAADIVSLSATPGTVDGVKGVTYEVEVADFSDQAPSTSVRILQNADGQRRWVNVRLVPSGVTPVAAESPDDPTTAEVTSASVAGNVISFFVPNSELGPDGAVVHNVQVATYTGAIQDTAPGEHPVVPNSNGDLLLFPRFTAPFTLL